MKRKLVIIPLIAAIFFLNHGRTYAHEVIKKVSIVIAAKATDKEKKAASELGIYLEKVYPSFQFTVTDVVEKEGMTVRLGLCNEFTQNQQLLKDLPTKEEGFLVRTVSDKQVIITSKSERGLFYAVYSLVEKLGCDFYLSYDAPVKPKAILNFAEWNLSDAPLQQERVMYQWHNFLSGCTGWDYKNWCYWIDQSAKMRYNTIMLHTYGNNPMVSFEYNGKKKAVGYINTSNKGRDWGIQHVNDVRLMPGGEVFDEPVFGAKEAQVPDSMREKAISKLMNQVFEHARQMDMKINLAVDLDTWSANPKNIIESLPAECLIKTNEQSVVNPDTASCGYPYYKAQVKSLITDYPQLNTITVWVRYNETLWRKNLKDSTFPENWRKEWAQLKLDHPEFLKDKQAETIFAFSKIVLAYQKALRELNRADISVGFGSWGPEFMPSAAVLMPQNCTLVSLDNLVRFETDWYTSLLKKATAIHKVIPIVWAHHDDHRYMGRPYTPYPNFNKMLNDRKATGFGIMHWTTRPLDIYIKSLGNQVWQKSENVSLDTTLLNYTQSMFGSTQQALQDYMKAWITKGPMFGRETSTHLFDLGKQKVGEKFEPIDSTLLGIYSRISKMKEVDKKSLSPSGIKVFSYYSMMEEFYLSLFKNQQKFTSYYDMASRESYDSAREIMATTNPEKTIELYSKASSILPITPGEKALIFSMATRWLPDYLNLQQRLRMQPIYYKFAPTQHDSLAQAPGNGTYFIDKDKVMWTCRGVKALGSGATGVFSTKEAANLPANSLTYFQATKPFTFNLTTLDNNNLALGKYKITLQYVGGKDKSSNDCKLYRVTKGKQELIETKPSETNQLLKTVAFELEVVSGEKNSLSIEPLNKDLKFTNLVISPIK